MVHAPPEVLTVEVSDGHGNRLAYEKDLLQTLDSPMCRLRREGDRVTRQDFWPSEAD